MYFKQIACLWLLLLFTGPSWADSPPLLPDDSKTPGVVASQDEAVVCGETRSGKTYSQSHRKTSQALKNQVFKLYGLTKQGRSWEVDHRLPLALGGADVLGNLWPQEGWQHPSYHDKDRLEDELWQRVCKKHTMPLASAQKLLLAPAKWTDSYRQVFGKDPFGAAGSK